MLHKTKLGTALLNKDEEFWRKKSFNQLPDTTQNNASLQKKRIKKKTQLIWPPQNNNNNNKNTHCMLSSKLRIKERIQNVSFAPPWTANS